MADPTTTKPDLSTTSKVDSDIEQIAAQRALLKHKHSQALSRLMAERADLRGVHALADLVDDSLRWSA